MKLSKSGVAIAAGYLLITLAVASPLVREGYIGHGNALSYFLAIALTSPLSVILVLLNDLFSEVNAFYMTGWPYFIRLAELAAGGLLNARLLYMVEAFARRKWFGA